MIDKRVMQARNGWHKELHSSLQSIPKAVEQQLLSPDYLEQQDALSAQFAMRVPAQFVEEIRLGEQGLRLQFMPDLRELAVRDAELEDPTGDIPHSPIKGLVHRYPNRVLLKINHNCPAYCRFCFRREVVGKAQQTLSIHEIDAALDYIAEHTELVECILSGGDPLMLHDAILEKVIKRLESMEHIQLLRIHTRTLTLLPSRITSKLLAVLRNTRLTCWIVVHVNSVAELNPAAEEAINSCIGAGIPLLSQTVLLKEVHKDSQTLAGLFLRLIRLRIKPYYLHYPDLAKGTSHFRLPLPEALALYAEVKKTLPGYAVPFFVIDLPLGKGKVTLDSSTRVELEPNLWQFVSPLDASTVVMDYR